MSRIWIPGSIGGSADLDLITAAAGDVLKNAVIIDKDGNPLIGTLELMLQTHKYLLVEPTIIRMQKLNVQVVCLTKVPRQQH